MAIYHCSLRCFSREKGHSAVAAAAYRSGQNLLDERTGRVHRYERRRGVLSSFIVMFEGAPERFHDRVVLWNAAEEAEGRKNSRVAREVIIALPHELNEAQRESLTRDMALYLVEKYRVAVDVAIHTPLDAEGHDLRNHHAHLLFTTRALTPDGFGAKTRILDDRTQGPQQVEIIREVWETLANDALHRAGHTDASIDRRTLDAQGIERIPQTHVGNSATHMEEKGKRQSSRGDEDDDQDEDEGDSDGDKGGDKDGGKKSGSGDTGTIAPDMAAKEDVKKNGSQDEKSIQKRDIPYDKLDDGKSRAEFNQDIKDLNERRKEYPATPLLKQIEAIEKEIDHLDRRTHHLESLLDKTSFPEKLQKLIGDIVTKAKDFLFVRVEEQVQRQLSEGERIAREERQLARYGRTYRVGLHTQIHDMREKIDILQSREAECKKYQLFVTMIETEVLKVRAGRDLSLVVPQKPYVDLGNPALIKNADVVKEKLPPEQAPQKSQPIEKAGGLQKDFEKAQMPIKDETGYKPLVKPERETQVSILSQPQTLPRQDSKVDPVTTIKTKIDVTAVDYKDSTAQAVQPRVSVEYRIPANAQTQKMLDKIQVELKEIKTQEKAAQTVTAHPDDSLKGQFQKPEQPPIKNEEAIAKSKVEAQRKRQTIPPEYRAKPYSEAEINPPAPPKSAAVQPDETVLDKVRKMWKQEKAQTVHATQAAQAPKAADAPKPRKTMSSSFNQAAKKPKGNDFEQGLGHKPDVH